MPGKSVDQTYRGLSEEWSRRLICFLRRPFRRDTPSKFLTSQISSPHLICFEVDIEMVAAAAAFVLK